MTPFLFVFQNNYRPTGRICQHRFYSGPRRRETELKTALSAVINKKFTFSGKRIIRVFFACGKRAAVENNAAIRHLTIGKGRFSAFEKVNHAYINEGEPGCFAKTVRKTAEQRCEKVNCIYRRRRFTNGKQTCQKEGGPTARGGEVRQARNLLSKCPKRARELHFLLIIRHLTSYISRDIIIVTAGRVIRLRLKSVR